MTPTTSRPRQPGLSLAQNAAPRIIEFEPIPDSFTPRAPAPFHMDLSAVVSAAEVDEIAAAGRMVFHCMGDTGGVKHPEPQGLVARGLEMSLKTEPLAPAFCYHLGDVVYYTGEVVDYWAQFYEPYEHYPLPIVAIPGNHDGELLTRQSTSLLGFAENLVAAPGTTTHESRDSGRMAGSQPWFYWTLTTPFATFIGLYTNVPEHGRLSDEQRAWFQTEMKTADPAKALVVALHHPVYSFDSFHSGSPTMALELQTAINLSRRVPNLVLSAHVHNYQRIELKTKSGTVIPFLVIGNGGYWNLHHLAAAPGFQDPDTEAKLIAGIDTRHGFMTFDISPKVINGHFTTVPRPQESWSDPQGYNTNFDVFSYPAAPVMLAAGEEVVLVPDGGSHLAPHIQVGQPAPPRHPASQARADAHAALAARTASRRRG